MVTDQLHRTTSAAFAARDHEHLLHPTTNLALHRRRGALTAVRGEGVWVYDADGRRYLEAAGGAWCLALGHGDEELAAVAAEQMRTLAYSPAFHGRSYPPLIELAERLKALSPVEVSKVFFVGSGSEANDTQVRLRWLAANGEGRPQRKRFLAREGAYHGTSGFSASLTGLAPFHAGFDAPADFVRHVRKPHYLREHHPGETEHQFVGRLADELDATIQQDGPDAFAAMIAEPVQAAGGVIVPPDGYFTAIQGVLSRHGIPLIADEVVTGFGRTAKLWGAQAVGMQPVSLTVAKQLSSAYLPIGAVLLEHDLYEAVHEAAAEQPLLGHGFTYGGHPVAAAVALRVLDIYEQRGVYEHAARVSAHFAERLRALADHPLVGEVQTVGLLGAVELVADKETLAPFGPEAGLLAAVIEATEAAGLLVRQSGARTCFCPPLIITEEEIDEMTDRFSGALDALLDALRPHVRS